MAPAAWLPVARGLPVVCGLPGGSAFREVWAAPGVPAAALALEVVAPRLPPVAAALALLEVRF